MVPLTEGKREELEALCERYHVLRLELSGSAATEQFDPQTSGFDFILEFHELTPGTYADHNLGLSEALEALFARGVDLGMLGAIKNPYFLEEIASTRRLLYAA